MVCVTSLSRAAEKKKTVHFAFQQKLQIHLKSDCFTVQAHSSFFSGHIRSPSTFFLTRYHRKFHRFCDLEENHPRILKTVLIAFAALLAKVLMSNPTLHQSVSRISLCV